MAKKKSVSKQTSQKSSIPFEQSDPIIVGGGGSVFILIRKDVTAQFVDTPASFGAAADNYFCIKCNVNVTKIVAADGFGDSVYPKGDGSGQVHPTKHLTTFVGKPD